MTMSYIPGQSFEMKARIEDEIAFDISATLKNNTLLTLDIQGNAQDVFEMNVQYKNNYLTSTLSYDDAYSSLSCSLF